MYSSRTNSLYKSTLWPMRLLMYGLAALPYEFNDYHVPNGKLSCLLIVWRFFHQILVAVFVGWLSMLRFHRFHEVLYKHSDSFSSVMDVIGYATLVIIYLIVYWENTWKACHYEKIFTNFELMRKKFRNLKMEVNVSRIQLYTVLLYSLLGLYATIIFFVILIRYIKSLNATRLLVSQYSDIILKLKLIEYSLFVVIVMTFQSHLNTFTNRYMRNEVGQLQSMCAGPEKNDILQIFGSLQDIYKLLIANVGHIENYFSWSLPSLLLKMFFEIILTSYWIYFSVDFKITPFFQLYGYCAIILQLIILFVTCYICSKCEKMDAKFSNGFYMTKLERHNPYLRSLLNEISLQMFHQKIVFTAGGFVDVNYRFFGKFIFMAVCYIVILIQFHMSV